MIGCERRLRYDTPVRNRYTTVAIISLVAIALQICTSAWNGGIFLPLFYKNCRFHFTSDLDFCNAWQRLTLGRGTNFIAIQNAMQRIFIYCSCKKKIWVDRRAAQATSWHVLNWDHFIRGRLTASDQSVRTVWVCWKHYCIPPITLRNFHTQWVTTIVILITQCPQARCDISP